MFSKRFEEDSNSPKVAQFYLQNRAKQLLQFAYTLQKIETRPFGLIAHFQYQNSSFLYPYIYSHHKTDANAYQYLKTETKPIILVVGDTQIALMNSHHLPFKLIAGTLNSKAYQKISEFYGDRKANRSQVFLMNHIDEGLAILQWVGADEFAKQAFCLHPILQNDNDFAANWEMDFQGIHSKVLILCMEYRKVANAYLSTRSIKSIEEISLSPTLQVNQMLTADKIQNYKDFLIYHKKSHIRSVELEQYFKNWLDKLEIIEEQFLSYKNQLLTDYQLIID